MKKQLVRCWKTTDPLFIAYHDDEWGTPLHDNKRLFELLVLEGFQAGLTWKLILDRREALKKAFSGFDPRKIAKYAEKDINSIMNDPKVIRNRAKIQATVNNARRFLEVLKDFRSFDAFVWKFVRGKAIDNALKTFADLLADSPESRAMSKELKERGFKFVGPTICYAFMQGAGLVNDHLVSCFRYEQIRKMTSKQAAKAKTKP
jgi:DNA-3-methyladenine glycosylase I